MSAPLAADSRLSDLLFAPADADEVRRIQRGYVGLFAAPGPVLDIGCGRGIFLDLLADAGVAGVGIDASEATAAAVRARGHRVEVGDALGVAAGLVEAGERFRGVFCSHLVEHLPPATLLDLLASIARLLEPGGVVVLVTPNPRNLEVLSHAFWQDPTHVRFYPRVLLERCAAGLGLTTIRSFDDPATQLAPGLRGRLRRWFVRVLLGRDLDPPTDSVVVLRKPA